MYCQMYPTIMYSIVVEVGLSESLDKDKIMSLNYWGGANGWEPLGPQISLLNEIKSDSSLELLIMKLKFKGFEHLIWKLEQTLILGKTEGSWKGAGRRHDHWWHKHELTRTESSNYWQTILEKWHPLGHEKLEVTERMNHNPGFSPVLTLDIENCIWNWNFCLKLCLWLITENIRLKQTLLYN